MTSVAKADQNIFLTLRWTGPSTLNGGAKEGGVTIRTVHFFFKDSVKLISISPMENITYDRWKLLFKVEDPSKRKLVTTFRLLAAISQIQGLTLQATRVTKSSLEGLNIIDQYGEMYSTSPLCCEKISIPLQMPQTFKENQKYTLHITATDDLQVSATLKEKIKPPGIIAQLAKYWDAGLPGMGESQ